MSIKNDMNLVMRLWYLSSSINSFFKRACAVIQWARCLIFGRTLCLLPYFMCVKSVLWMRLRRCLWSVVAYVIRTHIKVKFLVSSCNMECSSIQKWGWFNLVRYMQSSSNVHTDGAHSSMLILSCGGSISI